MDKKILVKLELVFRKVFNDEKINISINDSADTVNAWDSLSQIDIIAEIEKEFKIKIDFFEMVELDNVINILSLIKDKLINKTN
tara:strand:- start:256 stop:507 length:252 start_codon:yes stop_codon:yes gene_type:complete